MMRSPTALSPGFAKLWIRSASSSPSMAWPNTGPAISDSVLSKESSARCGERSTEDL
jgi:hypothetical protein